MQVLRKRLKEWLTKLFAWEIISFFFPVCVFVSIVLDHIDYIPIWDSRNYFLGCVLPAVAKPFQLISYNCSNHGSLSFAFLYSILQHYSFGNTYLIHLTSIGLMLTAFYFFYLVLRRLLVNPIWVGTGMTLLCLQPSILASTLNPSPDLVVLAFSILCLWGFLTNRLIWASLFGAALLFSKESGVIYYSLCCFSYFILFYLQDNKKEKILLNAFLLLWPFLFYTYFLWYKTYVIGEDLIFKNIQFFDILKRIFSFHWQDPYFYSALSGMFILNFQWVTTGIILLGTGVLISRRIFLQNQLIDIAHNKNQNMVFISMLTVSLCYVLARFPHFLNIRYYLIIFPLTTILFLYILKIIFKPITILPAIALGSLLFISCFLTIDPVSRALYGTFRFGDHKLLKMTSITHECCGYGRDQLVYNLQHIKFQTLLRQFSQKVHLEKNDVIITNPEADFFIYGNVANDNYVWTLKKKNSHSLFYENNPDKLNDSIKTMKFSRIFYLEFPNVPDKNFKEKISTHFKSLFKMKIQDQGYHLDFVELTQ